MIKLQIASTDGTREHALDNGAAVIGRAGDCGIKLADIKASRQHAKIEKAGQEYRLTDLGSASGTFVNDEKVTAKTLAKGDRIRVGGTVITVLDLDGPPAKEEAPAPAVARPRRSVLEGRSGGGPGVLVGLAAVALLVVGGGVAGAVWLFGGSPDKPKDVTPPPSPAESADARALKDFLAKIETLDIVTDDVIAQGRAFAEKYPKQRAGFDAAVAKLLTRRADAFSAMFADAISRVDAALDARTYAEALDVLAQFRKTADVSFEDSIREFVDKIDAAINEDAGSVVTVGDELEKSQRFTDAINHYKDAAPRFVGTKWNATFSKKSDELMDLAAAAAAAKVDPIARRDPKPDPVKPKPDPVKPDPVKPPADPPKSARPAGLAGALIDPINQGRVRGKFQLGGGRLGIPRGADNDGVTFEINGQKDKWPWGSVLPPTIFNIAAATLDGDALLEVAAYGYANRFTDDADRLLAKYAGDDPGRRMKASDVIARARGRAAPPDGGYVYDARTGWEAKSERDERLAKEETAKLGAQTVGQLLKDLSSPDDAARGAALQKLLESGAAATARKELAKLGNRAVAAFRQAVAESVTIGARDEALIAAKRKEALELYKQENHQAMEPVVKELWKLYYPVQGSTDNPKVTEARKRVEDIQAMVEQAGGPKEDIGSKLASYAKDAESQACWRVMPSGDQGTMSANHGLKELIQPEEYRLVVITNLYRVMMGKRALKIDVKLCNAARGHSKDMNDLKFFAHESPVPGKRSPGDRASKAGTGCSSENIFQGSPRGEDAFWAWFHSMGHHRNMFGDWSKMGCGVYGSYWTENF